MNLQEMISKYDVHNQFKVLTDSYEQVEYAWNNKFSVSSIKTSKIKNIILKIVHSWADRLGQELEQWENGG